MRHVPVLLNEVLEGLKLKSESNIIDCTLGDGGHTEEILKQINPNGKVLAIDTDIEAILKAKQFLYKFENRIIFVRDNFVNLKKIVEENKFGLVDGILLDLGWSTSQFEERCRGFSFQRDEPLDMRLGVNSKFQISKETRGQASDSENSTAADLVNNLGLDELVKIFKEYGEEKLAKQVAEKIVYVRRKDGIRTTNQLVEIILQVYREKLKTDKEIPWIGGNHPATKVFQALRIVVNDELGVLEKVLPQAIEVLKTGGRLMVISFHSLEDRIVKHYFKSQKDKTIRIINKKPIVCSEEEYKNNPPSRSAKLRIIEKI